MVPSVDPSKTKVSNAAADWKAPKMDDEWSVPGWVSGTTTAGAGAAATGTVLGGGSRSGRRNVIQVEDSYLPFLLEGHRGGAGLEGEDEDDDEEEEGDTKGEGTSSGSTWQATSGKGGRRSFGGLNKAVEVCSLVSCCSFFFLSIFVMVLLVSVLFCFFFLVLI